MSRQSKFIALSVILVFLLACNLVTQPLQDAQELAQTAQAVSTLIPVETLQALPSVLPTVIPQETLDALPSAVPTFQSIATDFGNALNPQGTPVQEWRGIPIMPQAIAGQEFSESGSYSFTVNATAQEVDAFYKQELAALGWTQPFDMSVNDEGGFLFYGKDESVLTIFITTDDDGMLVMLTLA